ncbi:hypothetical protein ACQP00_20575 [Dactylosporangium sp. CS-047395]|uniref:hypothetical protein n=1 Tax=Dactylosporangium sp. CS-047395 TaxID=3239936 RepID=UPI003D93966C
MVALALTVAGWQVVRGSSGPQPRDLVQQLFDDLAAHNLATWTTSQLCSSNPICGPGALASGYEAPQHVTIDQEPEDTAGTTRRTIVHVSYELGGQRITDQVTTLYNPGRVFGGFWQLGDRPVTTLTIPGPAPSRVTVAAVTLLPADLTKPLTIHVPPGRYTISRAETPLIAATQTTAVTAPGPPATVTLPADIPTDVNDNIIALIRDRIDECATKHDFLPAAGTARPGIHGCPFSHNTKYALTDSVTWKIEQYPVLELTAADDGSIAVATKAPGRAAIHYRWTLHLVEPRDWTDANAVETIDVSGRITTEAGALTWAPA